MRRRRTGHPLIKIGESYIDPRRITMAYRRTDKEDGEDPRWVYYICFDGSQKRFMLTESGLAEFEAAVAHLVKLGYLYVADGTKLLKEASS